MTVTATEFIKAYNADPIVQKIVDGAEVDYNGCWVSPLTPSSFHATLVVGGRNRQAHRYVLAACKGMTYDESVAKHEATLHSCDREHCVNPFHVEFGTRAENSKDMWDKGRQAPRRNLGRPRTFPKPFCPSGHAMVEANHLMGSCADQCRLCSISNSRARNNGVTFAEALRAVMQDRGYRDIVADAFSVALPEEFFDLLDDDIAETHSIATEVC